MTGPGTFTLMSGTYILDGDLSINGGAVVTVDKGDFPYGVTFFNTKGKLDIGQSNTNVTMSAPTSGLTKGILYFQARNNTDRGNSFGSGASVTMSGLIYMPNQNSLLKFAANGNSAATNLYTFFVVNEFTMVGGTVFAGLDFSSLPDGAPFTNPPSLAE